MQSIRFKSIVLSCINTISLVAAQNSTDEDSSPFSEDFSNNVFTDLGPSVNSRSFVLDIKADRPESLRYSAKSLPTNT